MRAPSPLNAVSAYLGAQMRHAVTRDKELGRHAVLDAAYEVNDLLRAHVHARVIQRRLAAQRHLRGGEPAPGPREIAPEQAERPTVDPREPQDPVGLVGVEPALPLATAQRAWIDLHEVGHLARAQPDALPEVLEDSVGESFAHPTNQLVRPYLFHPEQPEARLRDPGSILDCLRHDERLSEGR